MCASACVQLRGGGGVGGGRPVRTRTEKSLERSKCGFPLFPPQRRGEVYSGVKFAFDGLTPHAPHVALSLSHHLAGLTPGLSGAGAGGLSELKQPLLIHGCTEHVYSC